MNIYWARYIDNNSVGYSSMWLYGDKELSDFIRFVTEDRILELYKH